MTVRPAASILVYYRAKGVPRFLMGCRSAQHRFMPGVFVFPGGKVDAADQLDCELQQQVEVLTTAELGNLPCELSGFLNAGLRELTEETGYSLFDRGRFALIPLGKINLIARAITPPYSELRYDTLFFQVEVNQPTGAVPEIENMELENLNWYSEQEIMGFPISGITMRILSQGHRVVEMGAKTKFLAQI